VPDISRIHRIPRQRFVTIAIRPSFGHETREEMPVICPTAKVENFRTQGWTL
jgi:hypothetical protein